MDLDTIWHALLAACVALATILAVAAFVLARSKGPTAWARRIGEVELAVADCESRIGTVSDSLAKWRGREAARLARAARKSDDAPEGEPDPVLDPQRWKAWVNSGHASRVMTRRTPDG